MKQSKPTLRFILIYAAVAALLMTATFLGFWLQWYRLAFILGCAQIPAGIVAAMHYTTGYRRWVEDRPFRREIWRNERGLQEIGRPRQHDLAPFLKG